MVCKYVRKPHTAELRHHVIIVNEEALLGRGFAGTFPFPFSDAHAGSVAIRFAAEGEQAKDVPLSQCPSREVPPPPPGECPPPVAVSCPEEEPEEPEVPEVPEEPEVPEIPEQPPAGVIDGPEGPPGGETRDAPDSVSVLPAAGTPAALSNLLMVGLTLLLFGGRLLLRGLRRQSAAIPRSSSW